MSHPEPVNNSVRNILFIVNKHAGQRYESNLEEKIKYACERNKVSSTVTFTTDRGHGVELAQQATREGYEMVIAVGGDGTLNEVAQGLMHTGLPMGIIPRGSGNGLARHLRIPHGVTEGINQLFDGKVIAIDTMLVNGRLSLNVSGIGFDGQVTNLFGVRSSRGLVGYVVLTLREFLKFHEFDIEIVVNGRILQREAFIVAIANSSQYGNNARIAPGASVCDGLLHLNIVRKVPIFRLDFLFSFFYGRLEKSSFCEIIETKSLQLKTSKPVPYHIDGEPCGLDDSFDVQLIPGALHLIIPSKPGFV